MNKPKILAIDDHWIPQNVKYITAHVGKKRKESLINFHVYLGW